MSKPIVLILGAGASQPMVPTASDLMPCVINRVYELTSDSTAGTNYTVEKYVKMLRWLWRQIGCPPSFEPLLNAALDHSDESLPRDWEPEEWINAATHAAHHVALCITRSVSDRVEARRSPIVRILDQLVDFDSDVTVASLNWDDLVLEASYPWYDGYDHTQDFAYFDSDFFARLAAEKRRLLWLHGSIHLNRRLDCLDQNPRSFEFRWHCDAEQDLHGWVAGTGSQHPQPVFNLPIVTGGDKTLQLLRRPFFDYLSALYQDLLRARALMMLGYSGQDAHLNALITEGLRANSAIRRIVWVGCSDDPYQQQDTRKFAQTLLQVTGLPQYSWALKWTGTDIFRQLEPVLPTDGNRFIGTWVCLTGVNTVATPTGLAEWSRLLS